MPAASPATISRSSSPTYRQRAGSTNNPPWETDCPQLGDQFRNTFEGIGAVRQATLVIGQKFISQSGKILMLWRQAKCNADHAARSRTGHAAIVRWRQ